MDIMFPELLCRLLEFLLLNSIVKEQGIVEPNIILNKLHDRILNSLHKNNHQETNDGMDISVIMVDKEKMNLEFAGAMNSIYIICDNEIEEYKANIASIGVPIMTKEYDKKTISYKNGDLIYLFTDLLC